MAAACYHENMATALKTRLDQMDEAIELMQSIRQETACLAAAFFPEVA